LLGRPRKDPRRETRMFARRMAPAALLAAVWISAPLAAQEPSGEARIARLIGELGSGDYQQRQRATEAVAEMGSQTRTQLAEAARPPDPEVRLRASELLRQLKVAELWSPRIVTIQCQNEPAPKWWPAWRKRPAIGSWWAINT